MLVEFIEALPFTELLPDYLGDEDYGNLQKVLAQYPQAGEVIPGTGGFRKLRWADPRRRKGKRGGLRVIYYYFPTESQIWLMTLYGKDEVADLSPAEKRMLKLAIEKEARARAQRRVEGRK